MYNNIYLYQKSGDKIDLVDKSFYAGDSDVDVRPTRKRVDERPELVIQHQFLVYHPTVSHSDVDGHFAETAIGFVFQPKAPNVLRAARSGTRRRRVFYHVHVVARPTGGRFRFSSETPGRQPGTGIRADVHGHPLRAGHVEHDPSTSVVAPFIDYDRSSRGRGGPLYRRRPIDRQPTGVLRQRPGNRHTAHQFGGAIGADRVRRVLSYGPRALPVPADDHVTRIVVPEAAAQVVERAPRVYQVEPLFGLGRGVREPDRPDGHYGHGHQQCGGAQTGERGARPVDQRYGRRQVADDGVRGQGHQCTDHVVGIDVGAEAAGDRHEQRREHLRQVQDESDGHRQRRRVSRYPDGGRPAGVQYAQRAAGGRRTQHHDGEQVTGPQVGHGGDEQQRGPEQLYAVHHGHGPFRVGPGPGFRVVGGHGQYGPRGRAKVQQQVRLVAVPAHRTPESVQCERHQQTRKQGRHDRATGTHDGRQQVQAVLSAVHADRRESEREEDREERRQDDDEVAERPRQFRIGDHVHAEQVEKHVLGSGTVLGRRRVVRGHRSGQGEQVFARVL